MQFHQTDPVLITAGEDGTAKLWDLAGSSLTTSGTTEKQRLSQPRTSGGIIDIEVVDVQFSIANFYLNIFSHYILFAVIRAQF
jgi:WD40 repeat protein